MATREKTTGPLSREAIVAAAMALADADGVAKLSMRAVARTLGVEAMSLYHHIPNKEAILDAMVDEVFAEIHTPSRVVIGAQSCAIAVCRPEPR